jgi:Arc/MetJ family transcription regulator
MAATGATTKRATVEEALRTLIRAHDPAYLAELLRSIRDENGGNVQGAP